MKTCIIKKLKGYVNVKQLAELGLKSQTFVFRSVILWTNNGSETLYHKIMPSSIYVKMVVLS